jgi:hypothetical protein
VASLDDSLTSGIDAAGGIDGISSDDAAAAACGGAIGASAMNEFNPAVQARMKRLEEENARLRASGGSAESAAAIAGLEAELEDCRRLKTLFTTRYHEVSQEA